MNTERTAGVIPFSLPDKTCFLAMSVLLMAVICSCKAPSQQIANNSVVASKIVFLNFSISHDKTNKAYHCELINQKLVEVDGTTKEIKSDKDSAFYRNYLLCDFTDDKGNKKWTIVMDHPLYRTVEYQDENNIMTSKQLDLDSAQFSLRVNKLPGMSRVNVYQVINKGTLEKLNSIKIP